MKYNIEEIFKHIEYYDENFPENEVKWLIQEEEETRKYLIQYIGQLKNNIFKYLNEENYVGHIYAVIILSQFKEKKLCPLFLEILSLPKTRVFQLFDTIIPEYGARILASVYDNDINNILKFLNDKKANEYAKVVAIQGLKILCMNGELTKKEVEDFLISLLQGKLKDKKHAVLLEILYTAYELKMEKVLEILKGACKRGEYSFLSISEFQAEIQLYKEGLYANEGLKDIHNREITDAFEELKSIFESIEEKNVVRKQAEKLQNNIIEEINILGRKFQKGVKSYNLKSHLKVLSKDELYDIGKHLSLKGYYKLRKEQLIDEISDNYEELIKDKLIYFDEERINELILFVKSDGIRKVENSNQFNTFFYFQSYGLIYPFAEKENTAFIMPDRVKKILKNSMSSFIFRKGIKKNSEIINLVRGMIEAYGIMTKNDMVKRLELYKVEESKLYRKKVIDEGFGIYYSMSDRSSLVNVNIDSSAVVNELEKSMTKDDYKFFTKEELIAMSNYDWTESISYAKEFYEDFTDEFIIEKENFIQLINDIKADIQLVDAEVITQFMVDSINNKCEDEIDVSELKESKKIVRDLVSRFLDNIPLWKFKGRCMKEVNSKYINKSLALTKSN